LLEDFAIEPESRLRERREFFRGWTHGEARAKCQWPERP
jgi:hypothetical protein